MNSGTWTDRLQRGVEEAWARRLPAELARMVAIPSISPAFDPDWRDHGALSLVVEAVSSWAASRSVSLSTELIEVPDGTSSLLIDIPASAGNSGRTGVSDGPVLIYGHLDVQPPGEGWSLSGAFEPRLVGRRLYGRGTSDDKFSALVAVSAVEALIEAGRAHPRIVVLLETSEESSSVDLPETLELAGRIIGTPSLVLCLDAFVPDGERLWLSTSMRGIIVADLRVAVVAEGVHSGLAGGIAPSSFRILRALLDRIENVETGEVLVPELQTAMPDDQRAHLATQARLTPAISESLPLLPGVRATGATALEQLVIQCWTPSIAYTGVSGMPPTGEAGSVIRPETTVRLSIRVPPLVDMARAVDALRSALESAPPAGATVSLDVVAAEPGWLVSVPEGLELDLERAGRTVYGVPPARCGGGATIPVLGMLAARFPATPILPLGVVTSESSPHGPDEFVDLDAAARLTSAIALLLASGDER
ncbi:M20/M25/M40 family metallo-hydrolase [Microbacterium sp. 18062]|uniref:M20/M25/M40 family metallo-hydrolase n=1 Tax=Microbacterium sp. 18062 TaxID=2681410 RepID=UPI0013597AA4|nr:M20/M25/M40 family metallo-hydrolase [Microbacterium sp. 18062]